MLVTGRRTPLLAVDGLRFVVTGEPSVDVVREGVAVFRNANCDMVVGVGGGSVIDAAKAIAAFATIQGMCSIIGGGRQRTALQVAPATFHSDPYNGRHGLGGHAECGARIAGARRQGEPA